MTSCKEEIVGGILVTREAVKHLQVNRTRVGNGLVTFDMNQLSKVFSVLGEFLCRESLFHEGIDAEVERLRSAHEVSSYHVLHFPFRIGRFGSNFVNTRHELLDPNVEFMIAHQLQPLKKLLVFDCFFCTLRHSHKDTVHLLICVNAHSLWTYYIRNRL